MVNSSPVTTASGSNVVAEASLTMPAFAAQATAPLYHAPAGTSVKLLWLLLSTETPASRLMTTASIALVIGASGSNVASDVPVNRPCSTAWEISACLKCVPGTSVKPSAPEAWAGARSPHSIVADRSSAADFRNVFIRFPPCMFDGRVKRFCSFILAVFKPNVYAKYLQNILREIKRFAHIILENLILNIANRTKISGFIIPKSV